MPICWGRIPVVDQQLEIRGVHRHRVKGDGVIDDDRTPATLTSETTRAFLKKRSVSSAEEPLG